MANADHPATQSILDDLGFIQAPLWPAQRSRGLAVLPDHPTNWSIPVHEGQREFKSAAPFFVRTLGPQQLHSAWRPFCGLLRTHGIPIFSSVQALDTVPVAAVPARWGIRFNDEAIDANDLKTADAFELGCYDRSQRNWSWPIEVPPPQLEPFVFATRMAAGADTPIGIGLPLACHISDVQHSLNANVDFISLIARNPRLDASDLHGLVVCRKLVERSSHPNLPLLVTAPIRSIEDALKLLALGATAVCIDDLLSPLITQSLVNVATESVGSGMLAGISSPPARKNVDLHAVATALADLQESLQVRMTAVGARTLVELNDTCLRSTSQQCHQVTGVAVLSMPQ